MTNTETTPNKKFYTRPFLSLFTEYNHDTGDDSTTTNATNDYEYKRLDELPISTKSIDRDLDFSGINIDGQIQNGSPKQEANTDKDLDFDNIEIDGSVTQEEPDLQHTTEKPENPTPNPATVDTAETAETTTDNIETAKKTWVGSNTPSTQTPTENVEAAKTLTEEGSLTATVDKPQTRKETPNLENQHNQQTETEQHRGGIKAQEKEQQTSQDAEATQSTETVVDPSTGPIAPPKVETNRPKNEIRPTASILSGGQTWIIAWTFTLVSTLIHLTLAGIYLVITAGRYIAGAVYVLGILVVIFGTITPEVVLGTSTIPLMQRPITIIQHFEATLFAAIFFSLLGVVGDYIFKTSEERPNPTPRIERF